MIVLYILLAVVILLFMVLIHELGHYIAGKILKFKITEFSVGFGYPIFSRTSKKTGEKFSLRIFPLGGYCAFDGEEDDKESDNPSAFNNQKPWKRIIVFLAGVTANFITAIIFSWILLCTIGYDVPQIVSVDSSYSNPFKEGDVILEIDGTEIDFAFGGKYVDLVNEQKALAREHYKTNETDYTFDMTVKRDGKRVLLEDVKIYKVSSTNEDGEEVFSYYVGLESASGETPRTIAYVYDGWSGFCRSFEMAFGFAWTVLKSLWMLITFQIPITEMGGTFATISTIATMASQSMTTLLVLIPLIAANLAVFNLLPFPALDGSHVLFTLIEWIRGKPLNRKIENRIHFIGICILLAFVVIVDIIYFVGKLF
ncbi:MAG: site-2 protease family protein [Clostridiales bacterium]|nr:site-2 protease family protein [Clostridiales bacterium]